MMGSKCYVEYRARISHRVIPQFGQSGSVNTGGLRTSELDTGDLESCTTVLTFGQLHLPVVCLSDLFGDSQPEPGSVRIR